jgi:hypothetical protein
MAGFGSQKRGTGKAVKKFSIGGSSIYASAYMDKPGYTEATNLYRQFDPLGYAQLEEVTKSSKSTSKTKDKEDKEDKEELAKGGMPARNKKNFRSTESGAGMTEAGVKAYRRMNPGSKLTTAVTEDKPGPKRAARRKSYCARSAGQMKMFPKAAKDPNSRLRQARKRWKC